MRNALQSATRAIEARPTLMRWILGGPGALILAVMVTSAMPVWFPAGAAQLNHIAFPILLFPAIWAVPFFYVALEGNMVRCTLVMGAAILAHGLLIASAFTGG
ncbi:MAG: hypothetical protein AAGE18_08035 [Pseudomonadota bacterium]